MSGQPIPVPVISPMLGKSVQVGLPKITLKKVEQKVEQKVELTIHDLFVSEKSNTLQYVRRDVEQKEVTKAVHWGQRKLFLSELAWLLVEGVAELPRARVVYAGAAPGSHIPFLSDLFPYVEFVLYDPAPFRHDSRDNIKDFQEYFTDEIAAKYIDTAELPTFLASDIRNSEYSLDLDTKAINSMVDIDMKMQDGWARIMRPKSCFFKFRLPYIDPGQTGGLAEYIKGTIMFQLFPPQTSTETRLILHKPENGKEYETLKYDEKWYESIMFYHNMLERHKPYKTLVNDGSLTDDYDSAGEELLWSLYLKTYSQEVNVKNVKALSTRLDIELTGGDRNGKPHVTISSLRKDPMLLKRKHVKGVKVDVDE
jgi:hypothetical protein